MFNFFRKNKEDNEKMTTLEQIRKAYEDLSDEDKKAFHQSIADRVHESIAAQEKDDGDEDSQSAEAREHEALGAEHAAGESDTAEERENVESEDDEDGEAESAESSGDGESSHDNADGDWRFKMEREIEELRAAIKNIGKSPQAADDNMSDRLTALENKFN
nr:MAG TPA: hypothetical protein [Caudoviricetes sp.]